MQHEQAVLARRIRRLMYALFGGRAWRMWGSVSPMNERPIPSSPRSPGRAPLPFYSRYPTRTGGLLMPTPGQPPAPGTGTWTPPAPYTVE